MDRKEPIQTIKAQVNLTRKSKTHQIETHTYLPPHIDTITHDEGRSIIGEQENTTSSSLLCYQLTPAHDEPETTYYEEVIPVDCVEPDVQRSATADCCYPTQTSDFHMPHSRQDCNDQDEPPHVNLSDFPLNPLLAAMKNHLGIFQQYQIHGQDSLPSLQHFANQDDATFLLNRVFGSDQRHFNAIVDAQRLANASSTSDDLLPHIDSLKLTRQKAVVPIRGIPVSSLCSSEESMTAWDRETLRIFEQLTKN